jgi:glutamate-1-semialdehyde aminotransferase
VIRRGQGCRVYNVEGRAWIDYIMGWGAILLGHAAPAVNAAIERQLDHGMLFAQATELEQRVADGFCRLIPCAEAVWFGKNGSDACTAAVRIARAATGRQELALCRGHYHGFHDWFACGVDGTQGVPATGRGLLHYFDYNAPDSLESILRKRRGWIAAVMLEPVRDQEPRAGYLDAVRELAHREGALLIFDEMVTGLRLAPGGAQEYYGVTPDLACFGKALTNGLPLSLTAGARDLMRLTPQTMTCMTFQAEQLALAAAEAVIEIVADGAVCRQLWTAGETLKRLLCDAAETAEVRMGIGGPAPRQSFWFEPLPGWSSEEIMKRFVSELEQAGVLCNGNLLPSAAHDAMALQATGEAMRQAMNALAEAMRAIRRQ